MLFEALIALSLLLVLALYVSTKTGEGFFLAVFYSLIAAYLISRIWLGIAS